MSGADCRLGPAAIVTEFTGPSDAAEAVEPTPGMGTGPDLF
jgi:hypothetical protein